MKKKSDQDRVAVMMEAMGEYGEHTQEYGEHAEDSEPREAAQQTCVRSCSAQNCRHNADGARCTLNIINISDTGGCTEYEAVADDFEQDDDASTIAGISSMIPDDPNAHPSAVGNMVGKYLPDMIQ